MGINTGFCNVGNFGSKDRMDYAIIGAEANLAARLQSIAEPGQIVLSYDTYALVSKMVSASPLEPITMKGIGRQVIPYVVDEIEGVARHSGVIKEHRRGLNFFLDIRLAKDWPGQRITALPFAARRFEISCNASSRCPLRNMAQVTVCSSRSRCARTAADTLMAVPCGLSTIC
jgi:hypothetical protein